MTSWRILMLICLAFIFVDARRFHQKRETKSHICEQVYNNTNKVECYCIKDPINHDLIRTADCYLTIDGIAMDDEAWKAFKDLEKANKISISNTRGISVKYIPKTALEYTKILSKFEIKYGNIEVIDEFAFANLSTIKDVVLADNQIKILKPNAFAHLRNLMTISLDTNLIIEINRDVFIDLPLLEKIYLTRNKITTIHDKAFVHLSNLRELEINRNNLFSLNSETFSGLEKLEKLDLSGNSLEVIGDNTFLPLKKLQSLNLDGNKIQMLDEKAFNGLVKLKILSMAHNVITNIDSIKTFEGLKSLELINFKGNKLQTLKIEVMAPILNNFYGNISSLNVQDNNFPCDCGLDWFVSLMNKTQSAHLKLSIENLKCTPSAEVKEKWIKAAETDKHSTLDTDYAQPNADGEDYEYYDETQLNGQLFYTDVRYLLDCVNNSINSGLTTKATEITTPRLIATQKMETKKVSTSTTVIPSPTKKRIEVGVTEKITNKGVLDLTQESTTTALESLHGNEVAEYNEKKPNLYTTARLATVSAKPIESKGYYEQNMASDEAKPDNIQAHRSIQEIKDSPNYLHNSGYKNVGYSFLILTLLCISHNIL